MKYKEIFTTHKYKGQIYSKQAPYNTICSMIALSNAMNLNEINLKKAHHTTIKLHKIYQSIAPDYEYCGISTKDKIGKILPIIRRKFRNYNFIYKKYDYTKINRECPYLIGIKLNEYTRFIHSVCVIKESNKKLVLLDAFDRIEPIYQINKSDIVTFNKHIIIIKKSKHKYNLRHIH